MPTYGQFCPVARASELLAERWTPIIISEPPQRLPVLRRDQGPGDRQLAWLMTVGLRGPGYRVRR